MNNQQSQSSTNVAKQQSSNSSSQQKYSQYQSNKNLIKVNLLDKPRNSNIGIKGPQPSTQIKNLKFVPLNVLSTPILQSLSPRSDQQLQTISAPPYLQRKNSQERSPPKFQNSTKAYQTQQKQVDNYLQGFSSPEQVRYSSKLQSSKNIKMQTQLKASKHNVADERYSFSPIVYKSKQIKHQKNMERGTIQSKKPHQDSLILSEYDVYQTTQVSVPVKKIMTSFQQDLPNVCQTVPVTTDTSNFIKICQDDLQLCDVVDEPVSKENDKTQDVSSNAYQASNWNSVQQFYNNGLIQKSVNTDGIACINFSLRSVSNMSFTNQEDANRRASRNSNAQDYEANSKSRPSDQQRSTSLSNMQKRTSQLFQPSKADQGVAERLKQKQQIKTSSLNTQNQASLDSSYKKLQISKKPQPVHSTRKNSISTTNNSSKIIDFKQRSDRYSMLIQTNNSSPSQQPYSSKTSTAQSKKLIDQHKPKESKPIYGVLNERGKHLISNASKNFTASFGKMQNSEPKNQKGEQIKAEIRHNYMSSISSQNNLLSTKTISGVDPDHNNNTMLYSGTYNTSSHHTSICKDNSDQNNMDSQLLIDMSGVSSKLKVFVQRYSSEFALLKREVVTLRERNQFLESQLMLQSNSVTTVGSSSNAIPRYQKVQDSIARRKC